MHALLLIHPETSFREQAVIDYIQKKNLDVGHIWDPQFNDSFGIDRVKDAKSHAQKLSSHIVASLIVLRDIDTATFEAQNALLKLLEEPPVGIELLLTASQSNTLLPTVISRVTIRDLKTNFSTLTYESLITQFLQTPFPHRTNSIVALTKTRPEAISFLKELCRYSHRNLLKESTTQEERLYWIVVLEKTLPAIAYLERNVNIKAVMDILSSSLPIQPT